MFMRKEFHITTKTCVSLSLIFRINSFCKNILSLFLCIINGLSTPIYRSPLCNHLFDWQHIQTSLIIHITAVWFKFGLTFPQYPPHKRFLRNCCLYWFMDIWFTRTPFMTTKCYYSKCYYSYSLDIKHEYACTR